MKQYTEIQVVRLTEIQKKSLAILESKGINVSHFIRLAIKDKIKREWKTINVKENKVYCPF
jgi:hypothetical protein